jgi:hypothetical protein
MRALVVSSASFALGLALQLGEFKAPRVAIVLLPLGFLGYLCAAITWPPVARAILRARREHLMLATVVAGTVGALVGILGLWFFKSALMSQLVDITPKSVLTLRSPGWEEPKIATIRNRTGDQLFTVWIKVTTKSPGLVARDIEIEPLEGDTGAPVVALNFGGNVYHIESDVLIYNFRDEKGRESVLVRFYELNPSETRRLRLRASRPIPAKVTLELIAVGYEQERLLQKPGSLAFVIDVPATGGFTAPPRMKIRAIH